ncbi:phosphatidylserine decarboxylase [Marasmius sp. AFHP31]|nr:phosphatidylserine decarboxylase [Marasmius sp. AFHP31]
MFHVFRSSKRLSPTSRLRANSRPTSSYVVLRVQVVGCSGLPVAVYEGTIDPFVTVTLGLASFKTPVARTPNPIFNVKDTTFDFTISNTAAPGKLKFVVWDQDWLGKDYLGEATLGVEDWFKFEDSQEPSYAWSTAETLAAFSTPLVSTRPSQASQGEIILRLGFVDINGKDEDFRELYDRLKGLSGNLKHSPATTPTSNTAASVPGDGDNLATNAT